jgi:hypothetical protein
MVRIILLLSFVLPLALPLSAQNGCEIILTNAQAEFDAGRFHAVPALLQECLQKNQNREWEQRAYLLLAETYLLLEDPAKADESYLKVLKANPEFVTDETRDPIDLVYLSRKFTATPIFSVYGKIGLNTSFINVIHDVNISGQGNSEESYALKTGWQGGLGLDYHYRANLGLSAEFNYIFTSFSHNTRGLFREGNYSLLFTDRQTWLNIPVMVKYTHGTRALRPFVFAGYSVRFLQRDRADMVIDGDTESPVYDYKYKRNSFNSAVLIGGGLKYKWGLRYIFGEVRYTRGLTNLTDAANRYDQINQSWPYVDDDFRMNNVFVSIGYVHPFYKARKLKNARTKSVLRKTKKTDEETD